MPKKGSEELCWSTTLMLGQSNQTRYLWNYETSLRSNIAKLSSQIFLKTIFPQNP